MIPMVVDLDKKDCCEELIQDFATARFHERIHRENADRKTREAQAAQNRAAAAQKAELMQNARNERKRRNVRHFAVSTGIVALLVYAYTTFQISVPLFHATGFVASVYFGWCLNSMTRQFRRKNRRS